MRWQWHQLVSWTICKSFAFRSTQITMPAPHHSIFTGRMLFLTPNQQRQSTVTTVNILKNHQKVHTKSELMTLVPGWSFSKLFKYSYGSMAEDHLVVYPPSTVTYRFVISNHEHNLTSRS